MASPEVDTSPPSTPSTSSCPTPRTMVAAPTVSPALLRAARSGDERRLVKELLADPAAPDLGTAATAGGNTLLHVAASGGHAALAALLLRRAPALLDARNAALDTPLHLAARAGAHKVVALLIASSPTTSSLRALTRATNKRGETALHDAVRGGHEAAVRALAAADPGLAGLCGGAGQSPTYMAAAAGSLGIVRVLVKTCRGDAAPADDDEAPVLCSCTGPGGRTVLHAAVLTSNGMSSPDEMPKTSWPESVPEGVEVPRFWCGDLCKLRWSTVFDDTYGRRFFMCANFDSDPLPFSGLYDRPPTPPPLCSFYQWLDTEQSEHNKESVSRELVLRKTMFDREVYELEQEEKRKRFQEHLRKMKEEEERLAKEKRDEERERKREIARRAKEDAEDGRGKGKYPRWTQ